MKVVKKLLSYSLSIFIILLLWIICAHYINAQLILPSPLEVLKKLSQMICKALFWEALLSTFVRVLAAFFISLILGSIIGYGMSAFQFVKDFFQLPMAIIRSTPVIALILVALFWFTSDLVPVFVAVLMALPVISTSVYEGFSYSNEKLDFMSQVYRFSKKQYLKYIKFPQLKPHLFGCCKNSFGLCWKVVAAGEVLSLPKYGFGTLMSKAQVHLETSEVLAITLVLVIISFILEKIMELVFKNGR